jgi:hypothetical protein
MRFSQRNGYKQGTKIAQWESMDVDLLNGLWNMILIFQFNKYQCPRGAYNQIDGSNIAALADQIWVFYLKSPLDKRPMFWDRYQEIVRAYFYSAQWYEVYDFVEFIVETVGEGEAQELAAAVNHVLTVENAAYRFVDLKIIEITSESEVEEVEQALVSSAAYGGARTHLERAIELYADRKQPDLRNSIKESISAVESLAIELVGEKATLGQLLKKMEAQRALHPALKVAFSSLYGYTNDSDGIRHALTDKSSLTKSDARLMLICCSAFVNYVIELYARE